MDFDDLEQRLNKRGDARIGGGTTASDIAASEQDLATQFPGSLREYLARFGWLEVADHEFFGLGSSVPPFLNLTEATKFERDPTSGCGLPVNLLPLLNDGGGNFYCVVAEGSSTAGSIVFWDNEAVERVPVHFANDLLSWLDKVLNDIDRR